LFGWLASFHVERISAEIVVHNFRWVLGIGSWVG
jgi:hypothetical protein